MTLNNGSGLSFVYMTGWQKIDCKTYYFETEGFKQLELVKVADKTYYFVENGEKKIGFIKTEEKTYYLKDGVLTPNIAVIDGKKFFIDNEGIDQLYGRKLTVTGIISLKKME